MGDITAANAVFIVSVPLLLPIPQQLQGFAADDIFDFDDVDAAETLMGVDGTLSAGMIFAPKMQNITLQADSASNGSLFDPWYAGQQAATAVFPAQGVVSFPSLGTSWTLITGFLTRYKPVPDAKKILQPRRYRITWQAVTPVPIGLAG